MAAAYWTATNDAWLGGGLCLEENGISIDFLHGEEGSQCLRNCRKVDAVLTERLCGTATGVRSVPAMHLETRCIRSFMPESGRSGQSHTAALGSDANQVQDP